MNSYLIIIELIWGIVKGKEERVCPTMSKWTWSDLCTFYAFRLFPP